MNFVPAAFLLFTLVASASSFLEICEGGDVDRATEMMRYRGLHPDQIAEGLVLLVESKVTSKPWGEALKIAKPQLRTGHLMQIVMPIVAKGKSFFFDEFIHVATGLSMSDHELLLYWISTMRDYLDWPQFLRSWLSAYHSILPLLNLSSIPAPWAHGNMCAWRVLHGDNCQNFTLESLDAHLLVVEAIDVLEANLENPIGFFRRIGLHPTADLALRCVEKKLDNLLVALLKANGAEIANQLWSRYQRFSPSQWLIMLKHGFPTKEILERIRPMVSPSIQAFIDTRFAYLPYHGPLCITASSVSKLVPLDAKVISKLLMGDIKQPEHSRMEASYFKSRNYLKDNVMTVPGAMAYLLAGFSLRRSLNILDFDYLDPKEIVGLLNIRTAGYCRVKAYYQKRSNIIPTEKPALQFKLEGSEDDASESLAKLDVGSSKPNAKVEDNSVKSSGNVVEPATKEIQAKPAAQPRQQIHWAGASQGVSKPQNPRNAHTRAIPKQENPWVYTANNEAKPPVPQVALESIRTGAVPSQQVPRSQAAQEIPKASIHSWKQVPQDTQAHQPNPGALGPPQGIQMSKRASIYRGEQTAARMQENQNATRPSFEPSAPPLEAAQYHPYNYHASGQPQAPHLHQWHQMSQGTQAHQPNPGALGPPQGIQMSKRASIYRGEQSAARMPENQQVARPSFLSPVPPQEVTQYHRYDYHVPGQTWQTANQQMPVNAYANHPTFQSGMQYQEPPKQAFAGRSKKNGLPKPMRNPRPQLAKDDSMTFEFRRASHNEFSFASCDSTSSHSDCKPWDPPSSSDTGCKPWDPPSSDSSCESWDPSSSSSSYDCESSSSSYWKEPPCYRPPHRCPCRRPPPPPCPRPPVRPRPCPCVHTTWTTTYIWPYCTSTKSSSSSLSTSSSSSSSSASSSTPSTSSALTPTPTPTTSSSVQTTSAAGGSGSGSTAPVVITVTETMAATDCTTMVFCRPISNTDGGCSDNVSQISSIANIVASSGAVVYVNGTPVATITNTGNATSILSSISSSVSEVSGGSAGSISGTLLVLMVGVALLL